MIDDKIRRFAQEVASEIGSSEIEQYMFLFGHELTNVKGGTIRNYLDEIERLKKEIQENKDAYDELRNDFIELKFDYKELKAEYDLLNERMQKINDLST